MMAYIINETVELMGKIAFEGNIVPNEWFVYLRNNKGKIQTNTVLILADIVYWYRPIPIYDIKNSEIIGHNKKFKDDLLKLDYEYFKNKFGFSQKQTRLALLFLEEKELIFREFRKKRISKGGFNNVMYIGIYPKKIAEISRPPDSLLPSPHPTIDPFLQSGKNKKIESLPKQKTQKKDWTAKYSDEQKAFLDYLLNIKPEVGEFIERDHATWWIKEFGVEKIKTALQVYWQQVKKAKLDSTIPMPLHMGRYVRKALNDETQPIQEKQTAPSVMTNLETSLQNRKQQKSTSSRSISFTHSEESSEGVVIDCSPSFQKGKLYMSYMNIYEVNDKSVTFQKEEIQATSQEDFKKEELAKQPSKEPIPNRQTIHQKKNTSLDCKVSFTAEERKFLAFLLSIVPAKGELIVEKHATWWIKHFGISKIEIALQVYWQQVEKAKKDLNVPMPQNISKYVRYALNNAIIPIQSSVEQLANQNAVTIFGLEKANQMVEESKPGGLEKQTTYTEISMMSMFVNEVNDNASLTFQKDDKKEILRGQIKEATLKKTNAINSPSLNNQKINKQQSKEANQKYDYTETFTSDEKKFLTYLLNLIPAMGDKIEEKHATWWIKHFGIDKIKIALQVYWQQVDKARKDNKVPIPRMIGAYVRKALDNDTQPCRESDHKNKAFAQNFKKQMGWSELTITEKYCRAENIGKEWYYNLPETIFVESLRNTFENYYDLTEKQTCVA